MDTALQYYVTKFKQLKQGITPYGPAPHKPVLLISVLQAFKNNLYTENKITITPELVSLFMSNWNVLVRTKNVSTFALPFFHLKGEKFWHLKARDEYEKALNTVKSMSSFGQVNSMIDYAYLDAELFVLCKKEDTNAILTQFLLDRYFPDTKNNYYNTDLGGYTLFDELKEKILEEDAEKYRAEIEELLNDKNEEEIFLRSNAFKREIPQLYNNTCSISGMRITSTLDVSMIDACHIKRWSESHDDTRTNGIALCPNLHRAFDRGLIAIDERYRVKISNAFNELSSDYSIKQFKGKMILLPDEAKNYPLMANLEWHRYNVFKN